MGILRTVKPTEFFCRLPGCPLHFLRVRFRERLPLTLDRVFKFMATKAKIPAISYLRTSSAANVGADKDSDRRQREAIEAFTRRAGYELVAELYDAAVSGADPSTLALPPGCGGRRGPHAPGCREP